MSAETPPFLKSAALGQMARIAHGFFGRDGGVSAGLYQSLNAGLGSDDEPARVAENRRRVSAALGGHGTVLVTLHQIHSPMAHFIDRPDFGPVEGDGLVTNRPGIALGVLAADCMPFLFADPHAGIIGAAHAGWRGALAGVLQATVSLMVEKGARPETITAALGPCLRQPNFEVGMDVYDAFVGKYPDTEQDFAPGASEQKRQFDLAGFARRRLGETGVTKLDDLGLCTLANPGRYFSYRHARRLGQADYGRNLSTIMLTS